MIRAPQLSLQPGKFAHHKHRGSGDKIVLVFHIILQGHVTKESFNFMGGSRSA